MNTGIYRDLDNLYESIESLNNTIKRQGKELELAYKGIEQLNNIIHNAIEYMEEAINSDSHTELPSGKTTDIPYCIVAFEDLLEILKGEAK